MEDFHDEVKLYEWVKDPSNPVSSTQDMKRNIIGIVLDS